MSEKKDLLDDRGGMGKVFAIMFGIMVLSLLVVFSWNSVPGVKSSVNALLDPTAGALISWNLTWGMMAVIFIIALITTIIQKYTTDQVAIKELKDEQKAIQKEIRNFKDDPQKMMEMQQETIPLTFKILQLSMKATIFTIIPFILFFRWFMDFFAEIGDPLFFGFFSWFWFYLIFVMIFSSILRKIMKVH